MKRLDTLRDGERFVVDGETFTVRELPPAEQVAGETYAVSASRGGFWFHGDELVVSLGRKE